MRDQWKRLGLVACVCAALVTLGTGTAAGEKQNPPLRYFIGHEVVNVEVTATIKTTRRIEQVPAKDAQTLCRQRHEGADPDFCVTERSVTTREGAAGLKLVANPDLSASLVAPKGSLTEDEISVDLRDGMFLKAINVKSTGRAGDVITSLAKFAGVLLGGVAGMATQGQPEPAIGVTSPCTPFAAPYKDLPDVVRLFLWENATECERWKELDGLQKARTKLVEQRVDLELDIRGASGSELKAIVEKLKLIEPAIGKIDKDIAPRLKQFNASLEVFTKGLNLGTTTVTRTYGQVLQLSDLPSSNQLEPGLPEGAVEQVTKFPDAAKLLWQHGRVIVTIDPTVPVECTPDPTVPHPPTDKGLFQIAFRQGTPARLRVFIADQQVDPSNGGSAPTEAVLRSVGDRFDNVAHPCAPIGTMQFKRSAWSKKELSLAFDDRGFPTKLQSMSGSDGAAIAASLAAASTTFRDELATTVEKVVGVQENQRKIALDDATRKLEQLKKDKEILDAQLALDAGQSNFEAMLKQQTAAADLAQLQADLTLEAARTGAEQRREIDQIKVTVELLKQQLELLRAQQELAKANK